MSKIASVKLTGKQIAGIDGEIRYKHLRTVIYNFADNSEVYQRGGVTIAYRYLTPEELVDLVGTDQYPAIIVGFAGCSMTDNFDKKKGRQIAEDRLKGSQVVILGADQIKRVMVAQDTYDVRDVLEGPMLAQGLRVDLCI